MHRRLLDIDTMPSPEDGRGGGGHGDSLQHGPYRKDANFDTNMVIILAALLCALICALGLNSMVRCALRCSRRWVLESGGAAEGRRAATGVKKKALKEMPVAVYGGGVEIPATECPICLGEFMDGEKVRVLPQCNHWFHVRCVDVWLASHSSCPTCRRSLAQLPAVAQLPVVAQLPAVAVGRS